MRAVIAAVSVVMVLCNLYTAGAGMWVDLLIRIIVSVGLGATYLIWIRQMAGGHWSQISREAEMRKYRLEASADIVKERGKKETMNNVLWALEQVRARQLLNDAELKGAESTYRMRYATSAAAAVLVGVAGFILPMTAVPIAAAMGISLWRPERAVKAHAAAAAGVLAWYAGMPIAVAGLFPAAVLAEPYAIGPVKGAYLAYAAYGAGALTVIGLGWAPAIVVATAAAVVASVAVEKTVRNRNRAVAAAIP